MNKDIETGQNETTSNPSRRKLLKALTAGGAVAAVAPSEWTKPALKSVMLPAHAQSTGGGGGGGGGDDCIVMNGWAFVGDLPDYAHSFSMSVVGKLDNSCGQGIGTVRVISNTGETIVTCTNVRAGSSPGFLISFSCSESFANPGTVPDEGELVTFIAEFDNGCSCTIVRAVD
ncbi:MAG: hypothetical protein DHS20C01_12280 [marine bacterium B5-7]|nr:MAG: hypothetical protein DHS20C01_12280 [marine bacterium B5-7]